MRKLAWLVFCGLLMLAMPQSAWAVVEAPDNAAVGDYANVLPEETEQYIIEQNRMLQAATGGQIVVVTVDFLDGLGIEEYAYQIFNDWGIGDTEKNNGMLLLLVIGEENYWAMQGKGIESALSSSKIGDLLAAYLEPDFAVAEYDDGVRNVFDAFLGWYQDFYSVADLSLGNMEQIPQETASARGLDTSMIMMMFGIMLVFMIIVGLNGRRRPPGGGYRRRGTTMVFIPGSRKILPPPSVKPEGRSRTGNADQNKAIGSRKGIGAGSTNAYGGGSSRGGGAGRGGTRNAGKSNGSFGGGKGGNFGGGGSRGGGAGRR